MRSRTEPSARERELMSVLFRFVYRVAGAVAGLAGSLYAVAQSVRHYAYKRGGGAVNRKH